MTHALIWHLATYAEEPNTNGFPSPYQHRLIALAGLAADLGETPTVRVWASLRNEPVPLLERLDAELGLVDEMVTLNGRNFGLPVLRCNALAHSAVLENLSYLPHLDLADEIIGGFSVLTNVFGLPGRARWSVH